MRDIIPTMAKLTPDPKWLNAMRESWNKIPRGAKDPILVKSGVSKSTQNRMLHNEQVDLVGAESFEAIRSEMNKQLDETKFPPLPPPFMAMRSRAHFDWCAIGHRTDDQQLAQLQDLVTLGVRLLAVDGIEFADVLDAMRQRVEAAEEMSASAVKKRRASESLRNVVPVASDRSDKKVHGSEGTHRGSRGAQ